MQGAIIKEAPLVDGICLPFREIIMHTRSNSKRYSKLFFHVSEP